MFVIDKVDHLDRALLPQADESIQRLGFAPDAFVLHSVSQPEQWPGRLDELEELRARGTCTWIGVSRHHPDVVRAAIDSGRCDLVMFPVGAYVDARDLDLVASARDANVGTVCFKTFGRGKLVAETEGYGRPVSPPSGSPVLSVGDCVHYTLTIDPDVALLGLSNEIEQDAAFAAVDGFRPLDDAERAALRARAAEAVRGKGRCWWNP